MTGERKTGSRSFWDKVWRDKDGNIVLFQMPNAWLIGWAVLTIISMVLHGTISQILWYAAAASLALWALLEVFRGVNYFRRALGLIVIVLMIANRLGIGR